MNRDDLKRLFETVNCSACGRGVVLNRDFLTEEQKKTYQCEDCSQAVLENRVQGIHDHSGGKRLLVED